MMNLKNKRTFFLIMTLFVVMVLYVFQHINNKNTSLKEKKPPHMEQSGKNNDLNLIIINIDALRADHLGCYGYKRNTSSFIDSRAMEGVLFENALSNSSFTRESVAVLLSGKLPTSGGCYGAATTPSGRWWWGLTIPGSRCWPR